MDHKAGKTSEGLDWETVKSKYEILQVDYKKGIRKKTAESISHGIQTVLILKVIRQSNNEDKKN